MRVDPTAISDLPKKLERLGAKNIYQCFNCGNCTAICPLSDNDYTFPRRVIRYLQLGQVDRLLSSPEIWMCHGCGECSATCPRRAYPSEIMNAVRNFTIGEFAFPKFIARMFESPAYLPLLFGIPLLLLYVFMYTIGFPEYPAGEIYFSKYIEPVYIEMAGIVAGLYVLLSVLIGFARFSRHVRPQTGFFRNLIDAIVMIIKHSKFEECETNKFRKNAHLLVFYGFLLLGISTLGALVYLDFLHKELSLPLTDPVKILGNIGAVMLVLGSLWIIYERVSKREEVGSPAYSDWFFIVTLLLVGITGLALEALRFAQSVVAYPMYLVHLVFVFNLLIYAPHSKFAHLLYRGLTYVYFEVEREKKGEEE